MGLSIKMLHGSSIQCASQTQRRTDNPKMPRDHKHTAYKTDQFELLTMEALGKNNAGCPDT